jgi:hypothetical protein
MNYPVIFPLREQLKHRSPEAVRAIAQAHGFRQHPVRHDPYADARFRGVSEIWYKLAGRGYAIIRIDAQGHANLKNRDGDDNALGGVGSGVHGGVPHFHKEWISAEYFQRYLTAYVPQVVRYNDDGNSITGVMTDGKAAQTHIKR